MSFYSALKLVRLTHPPIVTGDALSQFLRNFDALAVLDTDRVTCEMKFGLGIDADNLSTEVRTYVNESVFTFGDIEWDYSESFPSLTALVSALLGNHQTIYRAFLNLGQLQDKISNQLTREPSEEKIATLVKLCEETWPVVDTTVSTEEIANRERLSELWLYDDYSLPHSWRWFVAESG